MQLFGRSTPFIRMVRLVLIILATRRKCDSTQNKSMAILSRHPTLVVTKIDFISIASHIIVGKLRCTFRLHVSLDNRVVSFSISPLCYPLFLDLPPHPDASASLVTIGVASPDFRPGHSRGTKIWPGQRFCLVRTTELLQNLVTSHFKMYTWSFCVVND